MTDPRNPTYIAAISLTGRQLQNAHMAVRELSGDDGLQRLSTSVDGKFYLKSLVDLAHTVLIQHTPKGSPEMLRCTRPPTGWSCSRESGHDGPCIATPTEIGLGIEIVILFGIVLGVIRIVIGFTCEPAPMTWVDVFKDVAHLFMGGLIVACLVSKFRWPVYLFWSLCALEVMVAILQRVL